MPKDHVACILDPELNARFVEYRERFGLSISQALRTLITIGLDREKSSDMAVRQLMIKEGMITGLNAIRKVLSKSMEKALKEIEDYE